jgi:hypothetical protein
MVELEVNAPESLLRRLSRFVVAPVRQPGARRKAVRKKQPQTG